MLALQKVAGLFKEAPGNDGGAEWQVEANARRGFCRPSSSRLHYANSNMACYSVLNIYRASCVSSGPDFQCRLTNWLFCHKSARHVGCCRLLLYKNSLTFCSLLQNIIKSKHPVTENAHVIPRADNQCVYPSRSTFTMGVVTPVC